MTDETASSLDDIRAAIDMLDAKIVSLMALRQGLVEQAGRSKRDQADDAVRAPRRVEAVIGRVREHAAASGASPEVVEATYRAMIGAFVDIELAVKRREVVETRGPTSSV
jgi:isochorismate pyruvate lyase